jgi:hypothetical protein
VESGAGGRGGVAAPPARGGNHGWNARGAYGLNHGLGYGYGLGFYGLYDGSLYGETSYPPPAPTGPTVLMVYPPARAETEIAVHSVIHEYGERPDWGSPAANDSAEASPVVYLIALRDKNIHAATTYWVDGKTLHYLDTDHKERQTPLESVDRDLSARLNRERRVPFNLP